MRLLCGSATQFKRTHQDEGAGAVMKLKNFNHLVLEKRALFKYGVANMNDRSFKKSLKAIPPFLFRVKFGIKDSEIYFAG
jgi:hypothetical protein